MTDVNPFALALNAQRQWLETATEGVETATIAPERLATLADVDVGQTPGEVVYTENKLELLHYEPLTDEQHEVPILLVYALINKPFIVDLQPDRSVVRRLLEAGHDVYLIDWNEPSQLDQHLTLDDYVNRYMDNCVDAVRERSGQDSIHLLGYCMGGTMAAMYAALYPEKIRTLGLMAAGLYFEDSGGVLELWGDEEYYEPERITDTFGNMPAEILDVGFALMDPVQNYVTKYVQLADNLEDEDFVENFARMERWLSEGIDVAGAVFTEFVEKIYQGNQLYENELHVGGEHVDVTNIDMPVAFIMGEYDHLIPAEASRPFAEVVSTPDEEVAMFEYPTGHIGLSVSGSSHRDLWPEVCEWYTAHQPGAEAAAEAGVEPDAAPAPDVESESEAETAPPEPDAAGEGEAPADEAAADTEGMGESEVETAAGTEATVADESEDVAVIDGIGPTYAERLRAAGIETVADLAAADAATVAEAAEAPPARVRDWLDQATGT